MASYPGHMNHSREAVVTNNTPSDFVAYIDFHSREAVVTHDTLSDIVA